MLPKKEQEFLRKMIERIPNPVFCQDTEGVYLECNERFVKFVGKPKEKILGNKIFDFMENSALAHKFYDMNAQLLRNGKDEYQLEGETASGVYQSFIITKSILRSKKGEIQALIGVLTDITHQKIYEKELVKAREEAIAANLAKDNFLANISHELRNPLTGIIGFNQLLLSMEQDQSKKEMLKSIEFSSERLLRLINDILNFSQYRREEFALENLPFNLSELLMKTVNSFKGLAALKKVQLEIFIETPLPLLVVGDPYRLGQIIVNLLGNAIKFTDQGIVRVEVRGEQKKPGDFFYVNLKVIDSGVGIKEEDLQKIFDKFLQLDMETNKKFAGTGLGLSIVKLLVNKMKGSIQVESTPGKGTSFLLRLPFQL